MSGGTDSSVAALLMMEQGYECAGVTMELGGFLSEADLGDAQKAAELLGISHHVVDFKQSFAREVIKRFIGAYISGKTPNPCIDCNRFIKFKKILEYAKNLGFHYMATGHYAKIEESKGRYLLKKATDQKKDQSYVLYRLKKEQLERIKFPLGHLTKSEVREIAAKNGFANAQKKESQDICFVHKNQTDYAGFIERYTGITFQKGDFVDMTGRVLGRHNGIIRYTTGQRKGLGLALPEPMYVYDKNPETNTVVLAKDEELYAKKLIAGDINLIATDKLDDKIKIKAKIRYNQAEQPAIAIQEGEDAIYVEFEHPQRAITRGQAVVLYDGDIVVGGGTIVRGGV